MENVVIIGSGPTGLTAGLYTARAQLEPILITGPEFGGQLSTTAEVENYPGASKEDLTGPELIAMMQEQAERFGTRIVFDEVVEVDFSGPPHRIKTYEQEYLTKAVIVATGANPRKLNVPGEKDNVGRGVSYCATCDGFFFRDKDVIVVGGGDAAVEEGIFLTKFANRVRIVHRRDKLRAAPIAQERAFNSPKIEFVWNTVVEEILAPNGEVEKVQVRNTITGEKSDLETDGVFVYIGHYPNSGLFQGVLEMDEHGYVMVDERKRTSIPGIFVAGELEDPVFRQAITSAGEGCKAAMQCEKYLSELEDKEKVSSPKAALASW